MINIKKLDWFDIILQIINAIVGIGFSVITIVAIFVEKNIWASILGVSFTLDWIINTRQMWGK